MLLILLPGMDGTGIMFEPFLERLSPENQVEVIAYPYDIALSYKELVLYVQERLPENRDFVLLAESFSGPIAYEIAKTNEKLRLVIFVASFIKPPGKLLSLVKIVPLKFIASVLDSVLSSDFVLRALIGKLKTEYVLDLLKSALVKVSSDVMSCRIREMANLSKDVQGVINKSVYIQAISDNLVSSKHSDIIKNISNDFRIYRVEGSHFVLQVNAEKCASIVEDEINFTVLKTT
ncbi:hypothetical protein MNBD_GAMMA11-2573 [hydrothermal vent metagenome]|uniref:Serine aminopeptidase S33 domain-containing protein n=1 Tax=hydrothermal vent metagenome TaxID=652676 RepID=A0A3B0WWB6_9ZZZZ